MWRPEGWENPNLGKRYTDCDQMPSGEDFYCCESFEEGADAMLEALKATGLAIIPKETGYKVLWYVYPEVASESITTPTVLNLWGDKGTLIFIPDEK